MEHRLDVPVAVLTGSLVIIPTTVKPRLEALFGADKITFQPVGQPDEKRWLCEGPVSRSQHDLVSAVTQTFPRRANSYRDWDKITPRRGDGMRHAWTHWFASFVGSFMLSNQMRGRAIHWPENPEKTSSVWHLVSIKSAEKNSSRRKRTKRLLWESIVRIWNCCDAEWSSS